MTHEMQLARHYAALVVPFSADSSIDESDFRRVCRHALALKGIDGLVVNAHAGEVDLLTRDERARLVALAAEEAARAKTSGRPITVVSGVVPNPGSTAGAVSEAAAMQEAGAQGLLLLGPSSFGRGIDMVPEEGEAYVRAVSDAVTIPILYFISGALSGINHTPELVRRLCAVNGVIGAKDTMWSPQGFDANLKVYEGLDKPFDTLTGNDNCVFYNFVSGAKGSLLILNLVMGAEVSRMFELVQTGDIVAAREIHKRYEGLVEMLFARPMIRMPSRHKLLLAHWGVIASNRTRAPIPDLAPGEAKRLLTEADRLGLASPLGSA